MQIVLPRLPYGYDALEPHISRQTLEIHHGKHHNGYVEKTKALAKEVRLADLSLEDIIVRTAGEDRHRALFNNAAQAWNHSFYWNSLRPVGGRLDASRHQVNRPAGDIAKYLSRDLGGYDKFLTDFSAAATGHFGSGWAWLVLDDDRLRITHTSNANTPLAHGQTALLTLDVWEHAYYLDYQNRRPDYVAAVLGHLLNWDFANRNLARRLAATGALKTVA